MVDHTFPQNDDPNDAENFGEWGGRQNISDYVEYGLNFQNVDYGNLVFDVTEGKCYTLAPDAAAATTGELRHRIDYGIHLDARGGKTLTDNAVNYVFVKPNVATDDAPEIVVNTTGTPPTDASLKIGELDTNNNTATELNRRPDVTLGDADIERLAAALDANGQDITNVGAFDSDSVSTGSIGNSGSAVEFTDVIHSPSNSNPQKVLEIGDTGRLIGSDKITLSDDESVVIRSGASFGIPGYVLIRNDDDLEGATFTFAGNNTNLEISEGSFAASDSDSNVCVFVDSNEDLILKNRLGSSKTFRVVGISI